MFQLTTYSNLELADKNNKLKHLLANQGIKMATEKRVDKNQAIIESIGYTKSNNKDIESLLKTEINDYARLERLNKIIYFSLLIFSLMFIVLYSYNI